MMLYCEKVTISITTTFSKIQPSSVARPHKHTHTHTRWWDPSVSVPARTSHTIPFPIHADTSRSSKQALCNMLCKHPKSLHPSPPSDHNPHLPLYDLCSHTNITTNKLISSPHGRHGDCIHPGALDPFYLLTPLYFTCPSINLLCPSKI